MYIHAHMHSEGGDRVGLKEKKNDKRNGHIIQTWRARWLSCSLTKQHYIINHITYNASFWWFVFIRYLSCIVILHV